MNDKLDAQKKTAGERKHIQSVLRGVRLCTCFARTLLVHNKFYTIIKNHVFYRASTHFRIHVNRHKSARMIEIGAAGNRIRGFETLDIIGGKNVDYVWNVAKKLPFRDKTFDLVYASHVLEHIPWYQTESVLADWVRILKQGGRLEIWVPDGLKICKALVDYELKGENYIDKDGWYRFNPEKEPCKWASGRIYTYGDGTGNPCNPNWHRALFTERYLKLLMGKAGCREVCRLSHCEVRSHDHGWINLGMTGIRP